jgi:intracellular proteinase inhibitor BsuPI
MRGTGTSIASLLLLAGYSTALAQTEFVPLNSGNQWVYRSSGRLATSTWTVEVARMETVQDNIYAVLTGFPQGETWLRPGGNGRMLVWNRETNREEIWLDFASKEEPGFPSAVDPCNPTARVTSQAATYSGPIGEFSNALEITYGFGGCADAGILKDLYLPYIGLVQRTFSTIAGPVSFDLIYARLGGVTVVAERELSFQLTLDRTIYSTGKEDPEMTARLTLRSNQEKPLELTFPSGQTFDLVLRNERGRIVYQWSENKFFPQVTRREQVTGERNWVVTVALAREGQVLPAGKYVAEGWLTTGDPKKFVSSVGFEIE